MSVRIDWNKLNHLPKDADRSFEEFCHHVASHLYGQFGTLSYFYNTPGSEFYLELNKPLTIDGVDYKAGDVIGWQAKFWRGEHDDENSSLDKNHITELENCFKTTVRYKGQIKLWIVCTPGFFVQIQWDKLYAKLKDIKNDCDFASWHRVKFEDFYIKDHKSFNGLFQYYFGDSFAIKKRLDEISEDTLSYLSKKFDVYIHTATDIEDALLSIVDNDKAKVWLVDCIKTIVHHVKDDDKRTIVPKGAWEYEHFSQRYWDLYEQDFKERIKLMTKLEVFLDNDECILAKVTEIKYLLDRYLEERKGRVEIINKELYTTYNEHKKDQILAGSINDMVSRVNNLEGYLTQQGNDGSICLLTLVNRLIKKDVSVFAEAGYGKTHFACSIASNMLNRDKPVFFVTGSKFRNCNTCESKLLDLLQLPESNTVTDMFDALDFVAEMYDCRLPIIIDGLNETMPQTSRWKEELPPLKRKIRERKNLLLITTCREKEDYIRLIYDEDTYEKVENHILLPGIQQKNLISATKRYFRKYDIEPTNQAALSSFTNPLLLKVFCEVNKGRHDFELNDHTLATCMSDYSRQLTEKIAIENGKVSKVKLHKIKEGLNQVAMTIWKKNDRQIDFYTEFVVAFDDSTEDFLNEGMCFIVERVGEHDKVQFAYDLVAGFHVAQSIIVKFPNAEGFCQFVEDNYEKLFSENRHTLAEDITKSLFYLVPIHYRKQWYELMPKAEIVKVAMDHLDIIASSEEGSASIVKLLENNQDNEDLKEKVCNCLYERVFNHQNIRHISLFLPFFTRLRVLEGDSWWNRKFAGYEKLEHVWSLLHDKFWSNRYDIRDKIALSILLCGIVDSEYRAKFYEELFRLVEGNITEGLELSRVALNTSDYFVFEAVVSVIAGVGLRTKKLETLKHCVKLLEIHLVSCDSNHLVLIDDLDTLYSYAKIVFGIDYDRSVLCKNKGEEWPIEDVNGVNLYTLYDYDFEKYNIRPLFEMGYHRNAPFTSEEVWGKLWSRIKARGYDEEAYATIQNAEDNEVKYRREIRVSYAHKIGRGVLMELYGWLLLNNLIPNEFKHTLRHSIIDIDPSHPKIFPKKTLICQSFMPKGVSDLPRWIEQDHAEFAESLFVTRIPGYKGEWVLMRGYCNQMIEEKYANFYLSGTSQLVSKDVLENEIEGLNLNDAIDYDSAFACELWWRPLEYTEDYDYDDNPPRLMARYGFSAWDSSRMKYPQFFMLNIEVAKSIGLVFDMKKMAYYKGAEQVSVYYVNDDDMYFYLRKDMVDSILKEFKAKLRHHIYERRIVIGNPPKEKVVMRDDQKYRELDKDIFYY